MQDIAESLPGVSGNRGAKDKILHGTRELELV